MTDCHRKEMAARGADVAAEIKAKLEALAEEDRAYAIFVRNVEARLRFFVKHGVKAGPAPISLLERAADILAKIHPGPAELKKQD